MKYADAINIHYEAVQKAKEATQSYLDEYGDGERDVCGFAWVKIGPATSSFCRALKKAGVRNSSWNGGYVVWNPSGHPTQNISSKEAGATAYADHLSDNGIRCFAQSRLD